VGRTRVAPDEPASDDRAFVVARQLGTKRRRWDTIILECDPDALRRRANFGPDRLDSDLLHLVRNAPAEWTYYRDALPIPAIRGATSARRSTAPTIGASSQPERTAIASRSDASVPIRTGSSESSRSRTSRISMPALPARSARNSSTTSRWGRRRGLGRDPRNRRARRTGSLRGSADRGGYPRAAPDDLTAGSRGTPARSRSTSRERGSSSDPTAGNGTAPPPGSSPSIPTGRPTNGSRSPNAPTNAAGARSSTRCVPTADTFSYALETLTTRRCRTAPPRAGARRQPSAPAPVTTSNPSRPSGAPRGWPIEGGPGKRSQLLEERRRRRRPGL